MVLRFYDQIALMAALGMHCICMACEGVEKLHRRAAKQQQDG